MMAMFQSRCSCSGAYSPRSRRCVRASLRDSTSIIAGDTAATPSRSPRNQRMAAAGTACSATSPDCCSPSVPMPALISAITVPPSRARSPKRTVSGSSTGLRSTSQPPASTAT